NAAARTEWFDGHDQSPDPGQLSTVAMSTARHGRASVTSSLAPSLDAYAATTPAPAAAKSQNRRRERSRHHRASIPAIATSARRPSSATRPTNGPKSEAAVRPAIAVNRDDRAG